MTIEVQLHQFILKYSVYIFMRYQSLCIFIHCYLLYISQILKDFWLK